MFIKAITNKINKVDAFSKCTRFVEQKKIIIKINCIRVFKIKFKNLFLSFVK